MTRRLRRCEGAPDPPTLAGMTDDSRLTTLLEARPPAFPAPAPGMPVLVEVPPGSPGRPPHRHSGPVFGYVLEGELVYELEGEPAHVIRSGEAFWEPGEPMLRPAA